MVYLYSSAVDSIDDVYLCPYDSELKLFKSWTQVRWCGQLLSPFPRYRLSSFLFIVASWASACAESVLQRSTLFSHALMIGWLSFLSRHRHHAYPWGCHNDSNDWVMSAKSKYFIVFSFSLFYVMFFFLLLLNSMYWILRLQLVPFIDISVRNKLLCYIIGLIMTDKVHMGVFRFGVHS